MATQKMATQNGDTKSGGAGGTPLAVTQEDCLVYVWDSWCTMGTMDKRSFVQENNNGW